MLALALLATIASSLALQSNAACSATLSGQWDLEQEGVYTLYNNKWNMGQSPGGTQISKCNQLTNSGKTIAWSTAYSWAGPTNQVKSFPNADYIMNTKLAISQIKSLNTAWYWTYTAASSNLIADVSYDLWFSANQGCGTASDQCSSYEIMVWLSARGGAAPAGASTGRTLTVGGHSFTLWEGTVSTWKVFSFVPTSGEEITNFVGDSKLFINFMTGLGKMRTSDYLVGVGAGTEPFYGSATLTTTSYTFTLA